MDREQERVLVTGAGGFIGSHLTASLKDQGYWVRGVDLKRPLFDIKADEFDIADLRDLGTAQRAVKGVDTVVHLAADMGGMGYIQNNNLVIFRNSTRIDLNMLDAVADHGTPRLFYSSSACVYNEQLQEDVYIAALKEEDAFPAQPQDRYGWEKLYFELGYGSLGDETGTEVRLARFHNIYGPRGTWTGGREKFPAAIARKVAVARLTGKHVIDIWGDGLQTRSFCYIDDCVEGIQRLLRSDHTGPLNIGSDRLIGVNDMAHLVADIAGIKVDLNHITGNQGVRGRNSDNTKIKEVLGWEPSTTLEDGMAQTYAWVEERVKKALDAGNDPKLVASGEYGKSKSA